MSEEREKPAVTIGTEVHNVEGEHIGTVRGFTDDGFVVTTRRQGQGQSEKQESVDF